MLRCSKAAYAKCPHRRECGPRAEATYYEGSECDEFNTRIEMSLDIDTKEPCNDIEKLFILEEEPC